MRDLVITTNHLENTREEWLHHEEGTVPPFTSISTSNCDGHSSPELRSSRAQQSEPILLLGSEPTNLNSWSLLTRVRLIAEQCTEDMPGQYVARKPLARLFSVGGGSEFDFRDKCMTETIALPLGSLFFLCSPSMTGLYTVTSLKDRSMRSYSTCS